MTVVAYVNGNPLWRSPDGREAWVVFSPDKKLAFICTDIHGDGMPHNSVGFTSDFLREVANTLDQMSARHESQDQQ